MRATPVLERQLSWRVILPVTLLLLVASVQVTLTRTAGLSPWKGGGFGMFSTTDDAGRRWVRLFASAPGRSEEIAVSLSLEDSATRAAVLPGDRQLIRLAQAVVEREQSHGRSVDTVRIQSWRIAYAPDTAAATERLIREFTYHVGPAPARRP